MADSIEEVVRTYLTTDSTFMANFTGVYSEETPDNATAPYINYWLVSDPGIDNLLNYAQQGEARIQFDLWDSSGIRGIKLRRTLAVKVRALNEILGGYHVMVVGSTEQTIPRQSGTDPFHYVVDGIVRWKKE